MVKKRKKQLSKGARGVGALVIGSTGASLIGSALPGTAGVPLQTVGTTMSGFVGPAATLYGAGIVIKHLKRLPRPKRKRVKRSRK